MERNFNSLASKVGLEGFTLLEVLFVVIVIAILAAIVIPRLLLTQNTAKQNACDANVSNINKQIELYYFNAGSWPTYDLHELLPPTSYDYFPDGLPSCPVTPSSRYSCDLYSNEHRVVDFTLEDGRHVHFVSSPGG